MNLIVLSHLEPILCGKPGVGNLLIITSSMNCALSLAGRKIH